MKCFRFIDPMTMGYDDVFSGDLSGDFVLTATAVAARVSFRAEALVLVDTVKARRVVSTGGAVAFVNVCRGRKSVHAFFHFVFKLK